jgi:predicted AlkP superfamily pyrophosphatase or phosphodiesterase
MYSSVDWSVTPRPIYKADGRKIPDVYSDPGELRDDLQARLGQFPLFNFWGPASSISASRWIADASMEVWRRHEPTLMLVYLPHLDYCLQKLGPEHPEIAAEASAIDEIVGDLLRFFRERGVRPIVVSEYGIDPVDDAVAVNRAFREAGLLHVREEEGLELLDAGASDAFAVADHQLAHVYVRDPDNDDRVRAICEGLDGVAEVHDGSAGFHERAGDLVLVSHARRWFTYDYWLDDRKAPDFARTVDIHRKPGYDPRELFLDPTLLAPKLRVARRVLQKKLGFRMLLDVIPLDTKLVRGSHGRVDTVEPRRPIMITDIDTDAPDELPCTAVRDVILEALFAQ